MAGVTELEIVNACRAVMGMVPIPTLVGNDDPNVTAILNAITECSRREQSRKWWFNVSWPTLSPDGVTGEITIPANTLEIDSLVPGLPAVQRGTRLYNPLTGSYVFTDPLPVYLVELLDFEDLPLTFQEMIKLLVIFQYQRDYDADPQKLQIINAQIIDVRSTVNAQHIRSQDPNFFKEGSAAQKLYGIRFPGQSGRWDSVLRRR